MRSNFVANLYDDLDPLYREIWGLSLHHGCWETGDESVDQARQNLTQKVIHLLLPKDYLADIGCGYGVLAHQLISEFNCQVTACTSSKIQAQKIPPHQNLTILSGDWLAQSLPQNSFDHAVAIESVSHFNDLDTFFQHTANSLKPGARVAIADWYSDHEMPRLAKLGELPGWRPFESFLQSASRHDLLLTHQENLSQKVAPTWSALFKKSLLPLRRPKLILTILRQILKRPALLWAFPFLRLAYHRGHLEYHLVAFEKADPSSPSLLP